MKKINKRSFPIYFYPAEEELLLNYTNSLKNSQWNQHDNTSNYTIKTLILLN